MHFGQFRPDPRPRRCRQILKRPNLEIQQWTWCFLIRGAGLWPDSNLGQYLGFVFPPLIPIVEPLNQSSIELLLSLVPIRDQV
jgi:hypothetical protein